jgi:hypothetical protein
VGLQAAEAPSLIVRDRLNDLLPRIHDEGPVRNDRFAIGKGVAEDEHRICRHERRDAAGQCGAGPWASSAVATATPDTFVIAYLPVSVPLEQGAERRASTLKRCVRR